MPDSWHSGESHWFTSKADADLYKERQKMRWGGHVSPYSVLEAAMGDNWVTETL